MAGLNVVLVVLITRHFGVLLAGLLHEVGQIHFVRLGDGLGLFESAWNETDKEPVLRTITG